MKKKPDVSQFAPSAAKKNVNEFLEGGAEPAEAPQPATMTPPVAKVQKIFRMRWDIAAALKMRAAQESGAAGKPVTETEIVEKLLAGYLSIKL